MTLFYGVQMCKCHKQFFFKLQLQGQKYNNHDMNDDMKSWNAISSKAQEVK